MGRDDLLADKPITALADTDELCYSSLSTYRNAIYGAAALWIVLFHGMALGKVHFGGSMKLVGYVLSMGNISVDIFILLSGIGLYYSLSKKPKLGSFYLRRLLRIYLPYLLLAVPYIVYRSLIAEFNFPQFIKAALAINYWTYDDEPIVFWYVPSIIAFYLLSPLLYRIIHYKERGALLRTAALALVTIAIAFAVYRLSPFWWGNFDKILPRLTVFIIGLYMGKLVKEKRRFPPLFLIVCMCVIGLAVPLYGSSTLHGIYYRYYGSLTGIALTFVMAQSFVTLSKIKLDKLFAFFGGFSLEIYIATSVGRKMYAASPYYTGHVYRNYLLFMIPFIVAAYLASLVQKLIFKKLTPGQQKKEKRHD